MAHVDQFERSAISRVVSDVFGRARGGSGGGGGSGIGIARSLSGIRSSSVVYQVEDTPTGAALLEDMREIQSGLAQHNNVPEFLEQTQQHVETLCRSLDKMEARVQVGV